MAETDSTKVHQQPQEEMNTKSWFSLPREIKIQVLRFLFKNTVLVFKTSERLRVVKHPVNKIWIEKINVVHFSSMATLLSLRLVSRNFVEPSIACPAIFKEATIICNYELIAANMLQKLPWSQRCRIRSLQLLALGECFTKKTQTKFEMKFLKTTFPQLQTLKVKLPSQASFPTSFLSHYSKLLGFTENFSSKIVPKPSIWDLDWNLGPWQTQGAGHYFSDARKDVDLTEYDLEKEIVQELVNPTIHSVIKGLLSESYSHGIGNYLKVRDFDLDASLRPLMREAVKHHVDLVIQSRWSLSTGGRCCALNFADAEYHVRDSTLRFTLRGKEIMVPQDLSVED